MPPQEKDPGLPTGLAVSGILLNVALRAADRSVRQYVLDRRNGAVVRFADEFIILAQSPGALFDLMESRVEGARRGRGRAAGAR